MKQFLPADLPRPELVPDKPYAAGLSVAEIKDRYGLDRIIKLASNENPLGLSERTRQAIAAAAANSFRYPRSGNPELKRALSQRYQLPEENLVIGNGSDEIIDLLLRLKGRPGQSNVLAFRPCFSVYGLQSRVCGLEFRQVDLAADFKFPWKDFVAAMDENTCLAFVTTPDNPSGYCPSANELAALALDLPPGCLLVIDEAYMDFARPYDQHQMLSRQPDLPNVAVMRTFSKSYGLAGLRLGFASLPPELARAFWSIRLPFSVNVLAEQAGLTALDDHEFLAQTLETVWTGRDYLSRELADLGFEVWPSQANFIMVRPPAKGPRAVEMFELLLRRGLIVRHLKSFGLEDHLRISIGRPEENKILVQTMAELTA